jgi:retron-type reverse transcriptase
LISKNQFGFQPGKSTTGALYEATKFIYNELDYNEKVLAVFLDLAKAFDTVDHKKLIDILPGLGIKNESLDWFKSYLKNRKQMVSINGILVMIIQ